MFWVDAMLALQSLDEIVVFIVDSAIMERGMCLGSRDSLRQWSNARRLQSERLNGQKIVFSEVCLDILSCVRFKIGNAIENKVVSSS